MLDDTDLFCRTCGDKQPEIIKQEDPQVVTYQNEFVAETNQNPKKKSKKKIIIPSIIIATLAIAAVVIYIVFFSDSTKAKKGLGIYVNDEFYEITVEDGIKGYEKIQGGIVSGSFESLKFKPTGSDEIVPIEQLDTATWMMVDKNVENYDGHTSEVSYFFRDGYIIDGLDGQVDKYDIKDAGYLGNFMFATEDGNVELSKYDDDFEKIIKTNTFHCLPYVEEMCMVNTKFAEYIRNDDVEGCLEEIEDYTIKDDKKYGEKSFKRFMCLSDLRHQYIEDEIDMIIIKRFTLVPDDSESDADHLLEISIFIDTDTVESWMDKWGLN